ncbi:hypothetical protein ACWEU6_17000 [Streptosporangium sandarakinum]
MIRFDGRPGSEARPRKNVHDEEHGKKRPRLRCSLTREFKIEIVGLRRRGDHSIGQISKGFDLTETAVRD